MRARHRHFNPRDSGATLVLDSRFITGLSDTDSVATWSDRSGLGNDATEATNQPTYQVAEQGGCAVVRFDGVNDLLSVTLSNINNDHTIICAAIRRGAGGGTTYCPDISYIHPSDDRGAIHYIKPDLSGASYPMFNIGGSYDGAGSYTQGEAYIISLPLPQNSAWSAFRDGVVEGGATSGSFAGLGVTGLKIGAQTFAGRFSENDYMQVMFFPVVVTSNIRKRLEHSVAYSFKIPCA